MIIDMRVHSFSQTSFPYSGGALPLSPRRAYAAVAQLGANPLDGYPLQFDPGQRL